MSNIKVSVCNSSDQVIRCEMQENQVVMVYEQEYQPGDKLVFEFAEINREYMVRIDDCLDESRIYVVQNRIEYLIPQFEKKTSLNPKSFTGERHYITARCLYPHEQGIVRNLAQNVMAQHRFSGYYPHALANVETRGEAVFEAKNAIDGILANHSHGEWPFASWGINRRDDAEIMLEFGREVSFDKIVLYGRADFPHDNWWVQARIDFSDQSHTIIRMEKTHLPQEYIISKKGVTWLKVSELIKSDDPSPFPALTQVEVYGKDY